MESVADKPEGYNPVLKLCAPHHTVISSVSAGLLLGKSVTGNRLSYDSASMSNLLPPLENALYKGKLKQRYLQIFKYLQYPNMVVIWRQNLLKAGLNNLRGYVVSVCN